LPLPSTIRKIIKESIGSKLARNEVNDIVAYYEQMLRLFEKATKEVKEGQQPPLFFDVDDED
jgi:hypothetical protein